MRKTGTTLFVVMLFPLLFASRGLARPDGDVLMRDRFEGIVNRNGQQYTRADVYAGGGKAPGGAVTGKPELVAGKVGKALRLHDTATLWYAPASGNLDLTGGEISFWVALNFDPMEKNDKTRTVLRNQTFLEISDVTRGYSQTLVYNAGFDTTAVAVYSADRTLVFCRAFRQAWKANEWHFLSLRWGRELELWCDGEKKLSGAWNGLFGPVPVDLKGMHIGVGTPAGSGINNEFTLDELTITGPTVDQISTRPRIPLPLLAEPPVLDGNLKDPFWSSATEVTGFVGFDKNEVSPTQPAVYAAYTPQGLYFGLEATLPAGTAPRALLTQHDSAIYTEDALEIYVQPPGDASTCYQFIASATGTRYDAVIKGKITQEAAFNPEWQVKTAGRPGGWTTEIFIPFTAFPAGRAPAAGEIWKGNFCLDSSGGFSNGSSWSFTTGNYAQPIYFGELLFTGKERGLRQEQFGGFGRGEPHMTFNLIGDFQPIITVKAELTDSLGQNVYRNSMLLRDTRSVDIKPPYLTTGTYSLVLSGTDEKGLTIFYQSFGFHTAKAFDFLVENYPYAGYLKIRTDARGLKGKLDKVVCAIQGPGNVRAGAVELKEFKSGIGATHFSSGQLVPGKYQIEARALAADGKVLEAAKQNVEIFAKPPWWKNNLGIDHSVPPPFAPVKVSEDRLSVWGREYVFGTTAFLQQITNQKVNLLVRAPTFTLKSGGQSLNLGLMAGKKDPICPDTVSITGRETLNGVSVRGKTTVEFDGFLRYDLTVTPASEATIDELTLSIPLAKELTRFLMTSNGSSSNMTMVNKPFSGPFCPHLWIGNDDMGLAWFADSDQYWSPKDGRMIQVVPGDKETLLKINIVTRPLKVPKPITFTFGLMATPVRPIPTNPFAYPNYSDKGLVTFSEFLTYPAAGHLQPRQGTLEFWIKKAEPKADGLDKHRNTQLFQIAGGKKAVSCFLNTPDAPDTLCLTVDRDRVLTAKVPLDHHSFSHLAFTWDKDGLSCYLNGRLAQKVPGKISDSLSGASDGEKGKIIFGAYDDTNGYTGIVLDEIRISKNIRYTGNQFRVPTTPFAGDTDTLLLDPLDESFKPDGQDAQTRAGGIPSIGGRFTPARFNQGLSLQVAPARKGLDVGVEVGSKITADWLWMPQGRDYYGQPYLYNPVIPELQGDVADYHRHGLKIIPYMAYLAISSTSGLIERYGEEWRLLPISTTPWQMKTAPPGYYFLNCCLGSWGYADYFAAFTAWVMDEFHYDGYYTDGSTMVRPCENLDHGCGYLDDAGNLHATWPLFATREANKRMYKVAKSKDPKAFVVNHSSFNVLVPVLSFSDIVYTGEHEDYENLQTARVRFGGRALGLYFVLIGSSEHQYSSLHAMVPLLNGSSVWGGHMVGRNDQGRKDAAIRRIYRDFGIDDAVWLPYYRGEDRYYRTEDAKVKASLYYHAGKDILLIVANLNSQTRSARLQLDLVRFGLQGKSIHAINTMTEETVELSPEGAMVLTVKPKSFRLIKVWTDGR